MVTYDDIASAAEQIEGAAHRTPVATSRLLDAVCGNRMFLKCENLQRVGAFKFRGAFNAVSRLSAEQRGRGVITHSSGNHAQALALVCRILGVHATIVMPQNAPPQKLAATRDYGAEVVIYDPETASREAISHELAEQHGYVLIPPYDHPHIIAGQGTAAVELIEDAGELDYLFVPCGGGGLLSGCAIAAKHLSPNCNVIGVEPAAGDDATRSFKTGVLQTVHNPDTIADGARTPYLGTLHLPAGAPVRGRHDDGERRRPGPRHALRLDAAQAGGRADRRAGPGRGIQPPPSGPEGNAWGSSSAAGTSISVMAGVWFGKMRGA